MNGTMFTNVFLGLVHFGIKYQASVRIIIDKTMAFGQNDQLFTGDVILLNGLSNENL